MDKRIPIVGGAALVAVILAVVVIGTPDTGGAVVEREIQVDAYSQVAQTEEGTIRGPDGSTEASDSPSTVIGGGSSTGTAPVFSGFIGKTPKRSLALERRSNPESNWAAHSMAPWTEVRRQLASQHAPAELVDEVQSLITDIRELRLDGQSIDFDPLIGSQIPPIPNLPARDLGSLNIDIDDESSVEAPFSRQIRRN